MAKHRLRTQRFSRSPLVMSRKLREYTSPLWLFGYILSRNVLLATAVVVGLILMNNGVGGYLTHILTWIKGGK